MITPLPVRPVVPPEIEALFEPQKPMAGYIEEPHKPNVFLKIPTSKGLKVYRVLQDGSHRRMRDKYAATQTALEARKKS